MELNIQELSALRRIIRYYQEAGGSEPYASYLLELVTENLEAKIEQGNKALAALHKVVM